MWKFPGLGSSRSYSWWPTPQPQQRRIQVESVTYTTSHGDTGSLTRWARPRIEPTTWWFLVGFVSAAPWQELQILEFWREQLLLLFLLKYSWFTTCQFLLYSEVTQFVCVCVCTFFFYIIFRHGLALCYIVGLYCLSILNVILCIH